MGRCSTRPTSSATGGSTLIAQRSERILISIQFYSKGVIESEKLGIWRLPKPTVAQFKGVSQFLGCLNGGIVFRWIFFRRKTCITTNIFQIYQFFRRKTCITPNIVQIYQIFFKYIKYFSDGRLVLHQRGGGSSCGSSNSSNCSR